MKRDKDILLLILEKEDAFSKEISGLTEQTDSNFLAENLKNYLTGLTDLKNDFLWFRENEEEDTSSTLWADRYWYFERT